MSSKTKKRRSAPAQRRGGAPPQPRRAAPPPRASRPGRAIRPPARSSRRLYAFAAGAALLAGALLIGLSQISAHRGTTSVARAAPAGSPVLRGIRQRGNLLGSAKAPYQLIEYTDLQCPFCARFSVEILPTIVQKYVRTGEVQLVMRGLAFIGQDSVTALRTATAAGSQNRMWNVTELLFANQGAENAWLSDKLLRVLVRAAGAKVDKVFAARNGTAVRATIARWARQAQDAGVGGTPSFYVGQRGGPFAPLSLSALTVADFRSALDGALGR